MADKNTTEPDTVATYEVLVIKPNGHQVVHRVEATSETEASRLVQAMYDPTPGRGEVDRPTITAIEQA